MVARYLPDVAREEFINVGVLLVCPDVRYQGIQIIQTSENTTRLDCFVGGDSLFLQRSLEKLENAINYGRVDDLLGKSLAPDGRLSLQGMFDLYQMYCNNIRFSQPRTAVTENPEFTLDKLFGEYVS